MSSGSYAGSGMATTLFRDTTYSVFGLIEDIRQGEVALPDIQRPFVWGATKVRDLLDSMYKGFPVGYLLFWETGVEAGARQIGINAKQKVPRLLIVDGQQRLTSLYAVITGSEIVKDDYSEGRIRIAFRPDDATFAVADAATDNDPEFIADISALVGPRAAEERRPCLPRALGGKRELDDRERDRLDEAIDRLHDLRDYPFKAVELASSVEEEQVAEVFVRINSEGVTLSQADFILTLMSVFWEKGRRQLEDFSRGCRSRRCPRRPRSTGTSSRRRRRCSGCRSRSRSAVLCSSRCIRCCAARMWRPAGRIQSGARRSSPFCSTPMTRSWT